MPVVPVGRFVTVFQEEAVSVVEQSLRSDNERYGVSEQVPWKEEVGEGDMLHMERIESSRWEEEVGGMGVLSLLLIGETVTDRVTAAAVERRQDIGQGDRMLNMLASWVAYCPCCSLDGIILPEFRSRVYAALLSQLFLPELNGEITPLNSYLNMEVLKTSLFANTRTRAGVFYVLVSDLLALGRTRSSNNVGVVV